MVLPPPVQTPTTRGKSTLAGRRGLPRGAVMGTGCQGSLSRMHLGVCKSQTAAPSKPSPVHFSKARSSWFFPSGRRRRWAERG